MWLYAADYAPQGLYWRGDCCAGCRDIERTMGRSTSLCCRRSWICSLRSAEWTTRWLGDLSQRQSTPGQVVHHALIRRPNKFNPENLTASPHYVADSFSRPVRNAVQQKTCRQVSVPIKYHLRAFPRNVDQLTFFVSEGTLHRVHAPGIA